MIWYRLLISVLGPVSLVLAVGRIVIGRGRFPDLSQRLGGGGGGEHGAVWFHGASNGELTSARALLEAFIIDRPDRPVIVTANSVTGRELVASWDMAGVTARLAPIDMRWALARFYRRWRPVALVSLENEFWPNRIATVECPILCVSARISDNSAARWIRFPSLCREVFGRISRLFPQDGRSAARFIDLGVGPGRIASNVGLKSGVKLPSPDPAEFASLSKSFIRQSTIFAASTHTGEDLIVLDAFAAVRTANPELRLIVAPRHPHRSGDIANMAEAAGIPYSVRSRCRSPGTEAAVYIADTIGEMSLWYALAGITFVGGSLVDKGGHTPFEPAHFGSAVLHGPYVHNFTAAYAALNEAGGALEITDAETLQDGIARLGPTQQTALAERASTALEAMDTSERDIQLVLAAVNQAMELR